LFETKRRGETEMSRKIYGVLNTSRKYHEEGCTCGYLVVIVAYECPQCKKRTPASEFDC
jgi:hypothetical protein